MKANITFDSFNYIKTFFTDNINGQYNIPDDFEFEFMYCYHLVGDNLILDETKKQEQINLINKEYEIEILKNQLYDTDYITARCFEEIMALDKPLTFISDFITIIVKYSKQYKEVIANRKTWRERIEELENEVNK